MKIICMDNYISLNYQWFSEIDFVAGLGDILESAQTYDIRMKSSIWF